MFVRYFVVLALPYPQAEAALLDGPERWVPGLARAADGRGERLLGEVGIGDGPRIDRTVAIEIGDAVRLAAGVVLPFSWRAVTGARLFPAFEADLELAGLGVDRTQLSINARYTPPMGAIGRAIDRALLHRVAEATVKDFLDHVAIALEAHTVAPG